MDEAVTPKSVPIPLSPSFLFINTAGPKNKAVPLQPLLPSVNLSNMILLNFITKNLQQGSLPSSAPIKIKSQPLILPKAVKPIACKVPQGKVPISPAPRKFPLPHLKSSELSQTLYSKRVQPNTDPRNGAKAKDKTCSSLGNVGLSNNLLSSTSQNQANQAIYVVNNQMYLMANKANLPGNPVTPTSELNGSLITNTVQIQSKLPIPLKTHFSLKSHNSTPHLISINRKHVSYAQKSHHSKFVPIQPKSVPPATPHLSTAQESSSAININNSGLILPGNNYPKTGTVRKENGWSLGKSCKRGRRSVRRVIASNQRLDPADISSDIQVKIERVDSSYGDMLTDGKESATPASENLQLGIVSCKSDSCAADLQQNVHLRVDYNTCSDEAGVKMKAVKVEAGEERKKAEKINTSVVVKSEVDPRDDGNGADSSHPFQAVTVKLEPVDDYDKSICSFKESAKTVNAEEKLTCSGDQTLVLSEQNISENYQVDSSRFCKPVTIKIENVDPDYDNTIHSFKDASTAVNHKKGFVYDWQEEGDNDNNETNASCTITMKTEQIDSSYDETSKVHAMINLKPSLHVKEENLPSLTRNIPHLAITNKSHRSTDKQCVSSNNSYVSEFGTESKLLNVPVMVSSEDREVSFNTSVEMINEKETSEYEDVSCGNVKNYQKHNILCFQRDIFKANDNSLDKTIQDPDYLKTPNLCPQCEPNVTFEIAQKLHMTPPSSMDKFQCIKCSVSFRRGSSLKNHVNTKHFGEGLYKCSKCSQTFVCKLFYEEHLSKNCLSAPYNHNTLKSSITQAKRPRNYLLLKGKSFRCEKCSFAARCKELLQMHKTVHIRPIQYTCKFCNIVFGNIRGFRKHSTIKHIKPKR